ncbi:hypothetical protein TYRP_008860 [Tyrophagus putrescentiae]|nr:hypothetical protein TYRP_008860 [Tyrophagus putrescentiae]
MRICIQSVDQSRLPSQCIYCKTRVFPLTVRLCTANTYLPSRMSLTEAYCLTTACRRQLPRMPPEPYTPTGISPNSVAIGNANAPPGINTGDGGGGDGGGSNGFHNNMGNGDGNGGGGGGGGGGGNGGDENYEEAESLMAQQPSRVRPPAKFFLGQPQKFKKPMKFLFG